MGGWSKGILVLSLRFKLNKNRYGISQDHHNAEFPAYLVLFTLCTTSSSVSNLDTQVTGPNISSCMHLQREKIDHYYANKMFFVLSSITLNQEGN